jgi:transposase
MCRFSMPPGYVRQRPAEKPKLGPLIPVIEAILEADRTAPVKQRHTAKRIFERLRDEHGFTGGYTVVKDHTIGMKSFSFMVMFILTNLAIK